MLWTLCVIMDGGSVATWGGGGGGDSACRWGEGPYFVAWAPAPQNVCAGPGQCRPRGSPYPVSRRFYPTYRWKTSSVGLANWPADSEQSVWDVRIPTWSMFGLWGGRCSCCWTHLHRHWRCPGLRRTPSHSLSASLLGPAPWIAVPLLNDWDCHPAVYPDSMDLAFRHARLLESCSHNSVLCISAVSLKAAILCCVFATNHIALIVCCVYSWGSYGPNSVLCIFLGILWP